jgi:hypothetical protein
MPEVLHPRAVDGVAGHPPDRVTVRGDSYECDGETVTLPDEQHVAELARAYDLSPADLTPANTDDGCPYCDDYDGDHVEQHVAQAHPDA